MKITKTQHLHHVTIHLFSANKFPPAFPLQESHSHQTLHEVLVELELNPPYFNEPSACLKYSEHLPLYKTQQLCVRKCHQCLC